MEQWEKNFYITALAGANNGSSLVVMSRGNNIVMPAQEHYFHSIIKPGLNWQQIESRDLRSLVSFKNHPRN